MSLFLRCGLRRRPSRTPLTTIGLAGALVAVSLTACTLGSSEPELKPSPARPAATPSGASAAPNGGDQGDPATDARYAAYYGQKVSWSACRDGFECTKVAVPVDWEAPSDARLNLSVIRRRATGDRLGSLFLNPGGPGVPGVSFLRVAASSYGDPLREAYDLVSWDPRGVGESQPLTCLPNSALDDFFAQDATPDTPAEETQIVQDSKRFAQACVAGSGDLLEHVDTISTIKDLDVLRAVVGDQLLTYMGASYGTYLGLWYAEMFPRRIARMVLDGVVDPALTNAQFAQGQTLGFSRALEGFVDDCLRQRECPLKGTRADAYSQLDRLSAVIDTKALRTDDGRELTQSLFTTGLFNALYSKQNWGVASAALTEAFKGNGTTLLLLADDYLQRDEKGQYSQLIQASAAISCLDRSETRTLDQQRTDAAALKAKYPPFGDVIGWSGLTCSQWPTPSTVPVRKIRAAGSPPIFVLGTTGDPATPYEWAQSVAAQLDNGHLLTRKGSDHTGYGLGSRCTDRAVEGYLVSGVVPGDGAVCS